MKEFWTRERCVEALAVMPKGYLRQNDAYDYCSWAPGVTKPQGLGLWVALQRHGLIRRTDRRIGSPITRARKFYWERVA